MSIAPDTTILDKYRIVRLLGQGGMARVWLAEQMGFGRRQVAIKEPLPAGDNSEEIQQRFTQELTIYAALEEAHAPNLVRVITVEQYAGQPLLVLEYLPGQDLAALIQQHPQGLPLERAIAIAGQVLAALRVAHDHPWEIVHRDIKPANVLFDSNGDARLADFGLAQLAGASQRSLLQGQPHPGTPAYMAPEQVGGTLALTPAADVYAVGAVLFEMLTGKRYNRMPPGTTARSLRSDVPGWLDAAVAKALQPEPYARYETAGVTAAALDAGKPRSAGNKKSQPLAVKAAPIVAAVAAQKRVLRVAVDGTQEYTSIQKAIDAAEPGATIEVYPGIYHETLVIKSEVNLQGIGLRDQIVIEVEEKQTGITIQTNNGSITNLHVLSTTEAYRDMSWDHEDSFKDDPTPIALSIRSGSVTVSKCQISAVEGVGVRVGKGATPVLVDNEIYAREAGVMIDRNGFGVVRHNKIDASRYHARYFRGWGIWVNGGKPEVSWNSIVGEVGIRVEGGASGRYWANYLGRSRLAWHVSYDSRITRFGNLRVRLWKSVSIAAIWVGFLLLIWLTFLLYSTGYSDNSELALLMTCLSGLLPLVLAVGLTLAVVAR